MRAESSRRFSWTTSSSSLSLYCASRPSKSGSGKASSSVCPSFSAKSASKASAAVVSSVPSATVRVNNAFSRSITGSAQRSLCILPARYVSTRLFAVWASAQPNQRFFTRKRPSKGATEAGVIPRRCANTSPMAVSLSASRVRKFRMAVSMRPGTLELSRCVSTASSVSRYAFTACHVRAASRSLSLGISPGVKGSGLPNRYLVSSGRNSIRMAK